MSMKLIERTVFFVLVLYFAMCFDTDSLASGVVRNQITDTVKIGSEDKYTITYYDKAYYDGSTLYTENLEVKCGEKLLANLLNYTVETDAPNWRYEDNKDGRLIHAEIKGIGDYEELSYSFEYTFIPYNFTEACELNFDRNTDTYFVYSGEEICPLVYVKSDKWNKQTNDYTLSDEFYTVSYENNVNAGKAKAVAKGIGLYSGTLELPFEINMYLLDNNNVLEYLRGKRELPVDELDPSDYSLVITDEEEKLAMIILSDRVKENYCFRAYSKAGDTSIKCSGLHIENYMDQWAYDICPDGEVKQTDGSFAKVCETHTLILKKTAYEASCESNGNTAIYKCKVCGRYFSDENGQHEIIRLNDASTPALGHIWTDWSMDVEPTTAYGGQMVSHCERCGYTRYKSLPKLEGADSTGGNSNNTGTVSGGSSNNTETGSGDSGNNSSDASSGGVGDNTSVSVPDVKKVSGFKLTSKKKKKLVLSWNKLSDIDGYEIQYSTDKKFKKYTSKKISRSKKTYTVKKLKSRSRYYVRIRGYKKYTDSNGKAKIQYGKWISKNKI